MGLVEYSDSDSESEVGATQARQDGQIGKKRKREPEVGLAMSPTTKPPPLPSLFHSLYATNVRTSNVDDPSLYGGRTRQVAHVEGNWPTHVYLEWHPSRTELESLESIVKQVDAEDLGKVQSLLKSDLGVQLPLHISLSAPLVLHTDQRSDFEERVEKAVRASNVQSFEAACAELAWVANLEGSRHFLVVKIQKPENDELNKLLRSSNQVTDVFGLTRLYSDNAQVHVEQGKRTDDENLEADHTSAFHISIAWQLENPTLEQKEAIKGLSDKLGKMKMWFETLKIKIGNSIKDVVLD